MPARSFSLRPSPPRTRRMRLCNISSIGSAKSVREVTLSWGPNRASAAAPAVRRRSRRRRRVGRRQRPRRPLVRARRPQPIRPAARCPTMRGSRCAPATPWSCSARGGTRTFRGPGTFSPSAAVRGRPAHVAASDGRRARIGAVRSAGLVPRSPTIWHVDVTQSGTFCLASTANVMLWRPDATLPTRLTVTAPGGARAIGRLAGRAGRPSPGRPGTPIANGATYSFRQPGVAVPTQITFRTLSIAAGRSPGGRRRADREWLPGAARPAGRNRARRADPPCSTLDAGPIRRPAQPPAAKRGSAPGREAAAPEQRVDVRIAAAEGAIGLGAVGLVAGRQQGARAKRRAVAGSQTLPVSSNAAQVSASIVSDQR